jgi:ABC-type sugar transport system substrate-binding protein
MMNAWEVLGGVYNFKVDRMSGEGDMEAYVQGLEVLADRGGVDGFFLDADPTIHNRVYELLEEFELPYVCMFNPITDGSGAALAPTLALDQYQSGYDSVAWLIEHYTDYWGDSVDTGEIGLINLDWSTSPPLHDRCVGATDAFTDGFPGNGNIFDGDGVTLGNINNEVGYNLTSQIVTAHTEVKYWMVDACVEDFAQGAARAAETLGRDESTFLITDVGSVMLAIDWDAGYEGSWISCYAISDYAYAGPAALGLIALVDGRATVETLWPERRAPGDKATVWIAESSIVTKDTYKEYLTSIDGKYGAL